MIREARRTNDSDRPQTRIAPIERLVSITSIAEPILGLDYRKGDRVAVRTQGNWLFVTPTIDDTLLFPNDHPLSSRSRYAWIGQSDGTKFGFLVEAARDR